MRFEHTQREHLNVQIRWLIRRDMPEVLKIERASFDRPWCEDDFLAALRQRNCIGMVAECDARILGFMVYELHKARLKIRNFAVCPSARRQGVGRQMVRRLIEKLSQQRRREIVLEVRESNLAAQLFFKSMEFRALQVVRGFYEDTDEDAYAMRYRLTALDDPRSPYSPKNRISQYEDA